MPRWPERSTAERFWSKVDRSGGPDACWPWLGYVNPNGYGYFRVGSRVVRAHRVALALAGALRAGEDGIHKCFNRICCNAFNPTKHLKSGTREENGRDTWAKRRGSAPRDVAVDYLGYCPWCGRDIPATFCDHCQREVAG